MKASVRHLLVQSEYECQQIKKDITEGEITFEEAASILYVHLELEAVI